MTGPLVALAALSAIGGLLNLPGFLGGGALERWLEPVTAPAAASFPLEMPHGQTEIFLITAAVLLGVAGLLAGWRATLRRPTLPAAEAPAWTRWLIRGRLAAARAEIALHAEPPEVAVEWSQKAIELAVSTRRRKYEALARTLLGEALAQLRRRDDAIGETFDKVAKLMGLGYPGGPIIERLAREGNPKAVKFSLPRMGDGSADFSFSGLKTAVTKHVRETGLQPVRNGEEPSAAVKDLAASFQSVVVRSLVGTTERLAAEYPAKTLIVAGGVEDRLVPAEIGKALPQIDGVMLRRGRRHALEHARRHRLVQRVHVKILCASSAP